MAGVGGWTETSVSDTVRSHVVESTADPHPSYPQSSVSDSTHGHSQLLMGRQLEINSCVSPGLLRPVYSPSTLSVSPKRRRLDAIDAHQSQMDCDSRPPGDQQVKTVVPTIHVNEDTDSPPTTLVDSAAAREGAPDSDERKPSSSPAVIERVADVRARPDATGHAANDEIMTPVDRKPSTEDS